VKCEKGRTGAVEGSVGNDSSDVDDEVAIRIAVERPCLLLGLLDGTL
jgi:hypothetical protein